MNRQQFISYVERTSEALRRFLVALCCGDTQLADDIAQETLIKAWLSCDGFREDSSFATWVRRIAYNTYLNHRRTACEAARFDTREVEAMAAPDSADSAFRYQALYAALARLTSKERTSIILHYLEGYSLKEIAEIEDTTPEAVKQHLSRGRTHLRHLLNPNKN